MSTETSARAEEEFDLDVGWTLNPRVAVRPERFGALLYHFDTRRLSFLKDPRLLTVLQALAVHPTARAACTAAGVTDAEQAQFTRSLRVLAASSMIARAAA